MYVEFVPRDLNIADAYPELRLTRMGLLPLPVKGHGFVIKPWRHIVICLPLSGQKDDAERRPISGILHWAGRNSRTQGFLLIDPQCTSSALSPYFCPLDCECFFFVYLLGHARVGGEQEKQCCA